MGKFSHTVRTFSESPTWEVVDELAEFEGRAPEGLYISMDGEPDYAAL